jgi:hypothetical protein
MAVKLATCRSFSTPSAVTLRPSVYAKSTIRRTIASFTASSLQASYKGLVNLQGIHRKILYVVQRRETAAEIIEVYSHPESTQFS